MPELNADWLVQIDGFAFGALLPLAFEVLEYVVQLPDGDGARREGAEKLDRVPVAKGDCG